MLCVCMCFSNIILFILFGFLAWSPPSSPASAFAKPVSARCRRNCCRNCAYKMRGANIATWTVDHQFLPHQSTSYICVYTYNINKTCIY